MGLLELLAFAGEAFGEAEAGEVFGGVAEIFVGVAQGRVGAALHGVLQIIQALLAVAEDAVGAAAFEGAFGGVNFLAGALEFYAEKALGAVVEVSNFLAAGAGAFGDQLGGGAGGSGAEVGDEIANGKIDFVADGADDGEAGVEDGAGDFFFVEGPEVFEAAAAAGDEDEVEGVLRVGGGPVVEGADGAGDFLGGSSSLDAAGGEEDFEGGLAAFDDVEDVAQGGAVEAGHNAKAGGAAGERALAGGGEEAFGIEALFEGFKGGLEFALALEFDGGDAELVLAARLVNGHLAFEDDGLAVAQVGAVERAGVGFEEDALDLGVEVFEGEVGVAGSLEAEVGDFAADPSVAEVGFEEGANLGGEFGDGKNFALGRGKGRAEIPL